MRLKDPDYIAGEVLVIGGGAAGLRAAIAAREQGALVLLVCKSGVGLGNNTVLAKGGLSAALLEEDSPNTIKGLKNRIELDNMLLSAEMVSKAALARTESRGAHYRQDYPQEDPDWLANIFLGSDNGEIIIEKKPIPPFIYWLDYLYLSYRKKA